MQQKIQKVVQLFSRENKFAWVITIGLTIVMFIIGILFPSLIPGFEAFPAIIGIGMGFIFAILTFLGLIIGAALINWATHVAQIEKKGFKTALTFMGLKGIVGILVFIVTTLLALLFKDIVFLNILVTLLAILFNFYIWFSFFKKVYGGDWRKGVTVFGSVLFAWMIIIMAIWFLVSLIGSIAAPQSTMFMFNQGYQMGTTPYEQTDLGAGTTDFENSEEYQEFLKTMNEALETVPQS